MEGRTERKRERRKDIYEEREEKRTRGGVGRPVVKIFAPIGAAEE